MKSYALDTRKTRLPAKIPLNLTDMLAWAKCKREEAVNSSLSISRDQMGSIQSESAPIEVVEESSSLHLGEKVVRRPRAN